MTIYPGVVARRSKGRIAVVTGRKVLPWGDSWVGVGLDGQGLWASRDPVFIAGSIQSYARQLPVG